MRHIENCFLLLFLMVVLATSGVCQSTLGEPVNNNGKGITQAEQDGLLSSRAPTNQFGGTFSSYGSLLFAVNNIAIHTESDAIAGTKLGSPFPDFYLPTWREIFDSIALQTRSKWKYDPSRNYWVFSEGSPPNSYSLSLADGWRFSDEGIFIKYTTPRHPVGMEIYPIQSYSSPDPREETKLSEKVRETLAVRFGSAFKKSITAKDMKTEQVDGVTALYFEAQSPIRESVVWRQWALVSKGKAFVIVSALDKSDAKLLEDVKGMVKSFQAQ